MEAENSGRHMSRQEATGMSTDPEYPTSTTIPGGAHKSLGVKVVELMGMTPGDSMVAVAGDGPSTAQPLPTQGAMGSGHVRRSVDNTTMEQPGGRRVSIVGATASEDVGGSGSTRIGMPGSATGESRSDEVADTNSTMRRDDSRFGKASGMAGGDSTVSGDTSTGNSGTYHDATTSLRN